MAVFLAREHTELHYDLKNGEPLGVMVASGPFTTADNLDYQPLIDFLFSAVNNSPDVIILTGPFVDVRHESVKKGKLTVETTMGNTVCGTHEAFFVSKVVGLLESFLAEESCSSTQIVLVPSLDDATAQYM